MKTLTLGIVLVVAICHSGLSLAAAPSTGIGQNGAPTVFGCNTNPFTHEITEFPVAISSGWVKTNEKWNSTCSPAGGLPGPNWREMTYYRDLPVGTRLSICTSWMLPPGWDLIGTQTDLARCGYHAGGQIPGGQPFEMTIERKI